MIRTELSLRLPNSPGALAGICRLLSAEHVNIVALSLEASGRLHLIVDNPVRATGALISHHHQVTEQEVLVVAAGNQAGGLAPVLALVSDAGVNVNYVYGTGAEGTSSAGSAGVSGAGTATS